MLEIIMITMSVVSIIFAVEALIELAATYYYRPKYDISVEVEFKFGDK